MKLEFKIDSEKDAISSMPNSWSEREAIRQFENARTSLRDQLSNTIDLHEGDLVKARMAFEEIAKSMGLDLRIPSISGRIHALFDCMLIYQRQRDCKTQTLLVETEY